MSTIDPDEPRRDEDPDRRPDDDIDAEFARLMSGLDLEESPLTVDDVLADAREDEEQPIAVVATSVVSAQALAGAIRLGREARADGLDIPARTRVHDTERGAIAVGPLAEQQAHDLAAIASTALQRSGIVLFWRRGDRMTATRYVQGERGADISPALVIGAVDESVERILLGGQGLEELGEGLDPSALTRAEALRWIAAGRKRRR